MSETALIALLFTDLVGSTELGQRLGEDAAEVLRRDHFTLLREVLAEHRGEEVKHLGDGLMVAFASPSDSLACAVAMQRAVEKANRRQPESLGLRVGVHAGEVTKEDDDYFGTAVVVAERLSKTADGGQIIVSDVLRILAGSRGGHAFTDLGPLSLKGLTEPVNALEVGWEPDTTEQIPFPHGFPEVDRLFFVGRHVESASLQVAWKLASAGHREIALIAGEPGIGKTRLATDLALDVHDRGATVLFGRCDEDLGIPYQPFAEALRHYVAHAPVDVLREHVAAHGGEIARLVPDLQRRVPDAPHPVSGDTSDPQADREAERFRLFEAAASLIAAASAHAPVLLVLDDLHWASKPTLLLLRHLLRTNEHSPLCIVGTYRDTDLARTHPFAEMLADLRRELEITRVALTGLDAAGVLAFIEAASGDESTPQMESLAAAVRTETEGNPFFIGQVLRHLVESGAVYQRDGHWTFDKPVERLGIPEGVREVVGRRLSRLSDAANKALRVASVVGAEFELALLERVPEASDAGDVLDALDEAVAVRIIDEVPAVVGRYRFTHSLVRQTLYEELTSARRVRIHQHVGEAIESLHPHDLVPHLPALTRHFTEGARGGNIAKAAGYAVAAARDAIDRAAYEEAIALAERGLQVLELDEARHPQLLADLWLRIAEANVWLMEMEATIAAVRLAIDAAREAHAPDRLAEAAYWFAFMGLLNQDEACDILEEALDALGDDFPPHRARLVSMYTFLAGVSGRGVDADSLTARALELARAAADPDALNLCLFMRGFLMRDLVGDALPPLDVLDGLADEAVEQGRLAGPAALSQGLRVKMGLAMCRADRPAYNSAVDEMLVASRPLSSKLFNNMVEGRAETIATLDGRFDDADAFLSELADKTGHMPFLLVVYAVRLGWLRSEQGRLAEAKAVQGSQVAVLPHVAGWRAALAISFARNGELEEAREHFEFLAAEDFRLVRVGNSGAVAFAFLAELAALLDDRERAARLYELGSPHAGRCIVIGDAWVVMGAADRYLGILATLLGRLDDAERHFRAALELESRLEAPPLIARTRYWFARLHLARGEAPRARELLEESRRVATELGMTDLAEQAAGIIR